jgi:multiple sugar transport system substrate-binding protein
MRTTFDTRTRRALASLAGSGAALALAACGQPTGGGAPSAGESAGARPGSAPALSGTVRFTFFGSAEEKPVWDKISEQFGARTPGVQVIPEHVPAQYFTKITAAVAGGDSADVILMEDKPTSGYAKQGYFRELDGFIGADRTFKYEDYYPGLFEGLKFRGQLYGLPQHWLTHSIYYNKDAFARAGVKPPPADWRDGSWNWTTFVEASRKLTLRQGGETTQWGFPLSGYSWTRWRPWIWQNGGDVVSQDLKRSVLDTPEAIEGLQFYADLLNVHRVAPSPEERTAIGIPNDIDLFAQGKAAMISSAPYFHQLRTRVKDFAWDIAPPPQRKRRATPLWPDSISMYAGTKAPDVAWALLRFVVGPEGQKTITELGRGVPVLKSVATTPAFLQEDRDPRGVRLLLDVPQYAVVTRYTSVWNEMERANQEELEPALLGKRAMKDAVGALVPRINALLQQAEVG